MTLKPATIRDLARASQRLHFDPWRDLGLVRLRGDQGCDQVLPADAQGKSFRALVSMPGMETADLGTFTQMRSAMRACTRWRDVLAGSTLAQDGWMQCGYARGAALILLDSDGKTYTANLRGRVLARGLTPPQAKAVCEAALAGEKT